MSKIRHAVSTEGDIWYRSVTKPEMESSEYEKIVNENPWSKGLPTSWSEKEIKTITEYTNGISDDFKVIVHHADSVIKKISHLHGPNQIDVFDINKNTKSIINKDGKRFKWMLHLRNIGGGISYISGANISLEQSLNEIIKYDS